MPHLALKWMAAAILAGWLLLPLSAHSNQNVITNVAGVRTLSAAQAAEARPVRLKGVVISQSDPYHRAAILADDTGGLYASAGANLFASTRPGDQLEITGVTDPGVFAPMVKVTHLHKLGTVPLPEPRAVTYHDLITGVMDAQWVEVSGVVQRHTPAARLRDVSHTVLRVEGNPVHVRSMGIRAANLAEDSRVRVRAVCYYQVNPKRQMLNPILAVPQGVRIVVEKPAPSDPFAAPVLSPESLLQFSTEMHSGHRVHVQGVATHSQGDTTVWIRDASSGLRLEARERESVKPGDIIDVLGFPKYGAAMPILEECSFRKIGTTDPPAPLALSHPTNAFAHEDNLVSIEAILTDITPIFEGVALTLTAEGTVFKAMLKLPTANIRELDWKPGSRVRAAGICSINYDDTRPVMGLWHPQSFQLLLRSPADLIVLQAPSWWTAEHIAYVLATATAVLLLTVTLNARRRLREQQRQRAMAEAEFSAILSERNRVAREIHDTLAQGLTATSFQLRLAKKHASPEVAELHQHLESAQQLVRSSLAEARNSIWNMRSQVLETGDLCSALKNIMSQMVDGSRPQTQLNVTGRARRFAPIIENNLLRVGQEAITNAVRHSQANHVTVQLDFAERQFRLIVRDDGCGFDPANPPKTSGGFGLVGMRERAEEIRGTLEIQTSPGKGCEICLAVPLPLGDRRDHFAEAG